MQNTKIEWCDATWNPVTGCLHGCEYCYAKDIVHRFKGKQLLNENGQPLIFTADCKPTEWYDFSEQFYKRTKKGKLMKSVYPFGFTPTFHRYWLDKPQTWKKPLTIFVGDMCDLFGDWVPDKWIEEVFKACVAAPQHRYLFLTKNPKRYYQLAHVGKLPPQHWYGTTVTHSIGLIFGKKPYFDIGLKQYTSYSRGFAGGEWSRFNTFISLEPMYNADYRLHHRAQVDFVIIGAETGDNAKKNAPTKEYININISGADMNCGKVFMKDSLLPIVGEENMRREFPWQRESPSQK